MKVAIIGGGTAGAAAALRAVSAGAQADDAMRAVPAALERYTELRRSHLRYYQFASRWLTPAFQSDGRIVPALRDIFSGPMGKMPFVSGHMLDTLVGVKAGLLFGRVVAPYSTLESPMPAG